MHLPLKIWLISLLLWPLAATADEIVEEGISAKALGMGNAYLVHGKGHDSIYYNPAGLAKMTGFQWRIMGMNLGLNGLDSYSEYADMVDNSDDLPSVLNQLYGRPIWGRADLQTSISWGPFMIGGAGRSNMGFTLHNPALPELNTGYFADYSVFGGAGLPLIPGILDVGVIAKRITRYSGGGSIGASVLGFLDSDILEERFKRSGTGYGVDWGAKLRLPTDWNPSVGFAWRDVGHTSYNLHKTDIGPESTPDQMSVGLGLEKDFTAFVVRPEINYKYLNASNTQIGKKLHAGLEIEMPVVTLRGGYNQGYYTAGVSFDFWIFEIDMATYGVELGEYVGQKEDRRYLLQIAADFSIDSVSGSWFSLNKERRKGLKQRR